MVDIKTKSKSTIKKLDSAVVKTQNIKNNIIELKDRTKEINNSEEKSVNDYVYNKFENGATRIKGKSTYTFNNIGKNSIKDTKTSIKNLKDKIENYKIKSKNQRTDIKSDNLKVHQNIKLGKLKYKRNKENINNTNRILNNSKKIVQNKAGKNKNTINRITKSIKAMFTGTKALISLITAGGFISVVIILIICILGAVMSIYNFDGNNETQGSIVYVAKSQLGVKGGEPYWRWYGFEERVEWCAIFVSWCAEQIGYIENGEIPKYSRCGDGIKEFKEKDKWQDRNENYIPKMSDIIFFDWDADGISDHTGIVESVDFENEKVKTIEGNSGDQVQEQEYDLTDKCIIGYGLPDYKE